MAHTNTTTQTTSRKGNVNWDEIFTLETTDTCTPTREKVGDATEIAFLRIHDTYMMDDKSTRTTFGGNPEKGLVSEKGGNAPASPIHISGTDSSLSANVHTIKVNEKTTAPGTLNTNQSSDTNVGLFTSHSAFMTQGDVSLNTVAYLNFNGGTNSSLSSGKGPGYYDYRLVTGSSAGENDGTNGSVSIGSTIKGNGKSHGISFSTTSTSDGSKEDGGWKSGYSSQAVTVSANVGTYTFKNDGATDSGTNTDKSIVKMVSSSSSNSSGPYGSNTSTGKSSTTQFTCQEGTHESDSLTFTSATHTQSLELTENTGQWYSSYNNPNVPSITIASGGSYHVVLESIAVSDTDTTQNINPNEKGGGDGSGVSHSLTTRFTHIVEENKVQSLGNPPTVTTNESWVLNFDESTSTTDPEGNTSITDTHMTMALTPEEFRDLIPNDFVGNITMTIDDVTGANNGLRGLLKDLGKAVQDTRGLLPRGDYATLASVEGGGANNLSGAASMIAIAGNNFNPVALGLVDAKGY